MSRLPIGLRVTLAFAGVMTAVLAVIGVTVHLLFAAQLDATVDRALRSRAGDVIELVRQADSGLTRREASPLAESEENFAQILDTSGRVVDGSPALRAVALLDAGQVSRAARATITLERPSTIEPDVPTRLLATPVRVDGRPLVVVVGAALDDDEEALAQLALLLAIGGPVALLLASLAGYAMASAALAPVEQMRRTAAAIGDHGAGERLPVGAADDEISRLGSTLNAMLDRLETAFERERTFVADASHELRTPLAILKTELELALRRGRTHEELHATLTSVAEETERLAQLADALLVIARADDGRLPIATAPVDLTVLLDAVVRRFDVRVRDAGRDIAVDDVCPGGLTGDPDRLEQALGSLVENALQHGDGSIRLSAVTSAAGVRLQVHDGGPGFDTGFLPQAFERFARDDRARSRPGSGLGLAIVQVIARAHGGEAGAANGDGGGAVVWIELPRRRQVAGASSCAPHSFAGS